MILTAQQIKELAEFAGMVVTHDDLDDVLMGAEYVLAPCPSGGVPHDGESGELGTFSHYTLVVYCAECPEEGCIGLGPEIPK